MRIIISTNTVDWPLHQNLTDDQILDKLKAQVVNQDNEKLDIKININRSSVNIDQTGTYPLLLTAIDKHGNTDSQKVTADIHPMREHNEDKQIKYGPKSKTKKQNNKRWLYIVLAVITILLVVFGLSRCSKNHSQQVQNNSQQSSQIASNSSKINTLNDKNEALQREVNELTGAVKQYQKDQNQQKLLDKLTDIQADNGQYLDSNNSPALRGRAQRIDNAINDIKQNPEAGKNELEQLADEPELENYFNNLASEFQRFLEQN